MREGRSVIRRNMSFRLVSQLERWLGKEDKKKRGDKKNQHECMTTGAPTRKSTQGSRPWL